MLRVHAPHGGVSGHGSGPLKSWTTLATSKTETSLQESLAGLEHQNGGQLVSWGQVAADGA